MIWGGDKFKLSKAFLPHYDVAIWTTGSKKCLFSSLSNASPIPHCLHRMGPSSQPCPATVPSFSTASITPAFSLLSQWKSYLPFSKASLFTSFTLEPPPFSFPRNCLSSSSMPSPYEWAHLLYLKLNKINKMVLFLVPNCL